MNIMVVEDYLALFLKKNIEHVFQSLSMIVQSDKKIDKQHIGVVFDTIETVVLN